MEFLLNRYRNLTVLLVVILAQLVLLAYQVKSNGEVRLIRVWAVSAVTPLARVIEAGRSSTVHFFRDYFILLDVRQENQRIKADLDRTKMENQYLPYRALDRRPRQVPRHLPTAVAVQNHRRARDRQHHRCGRESGDRRSRHRQRRSKRYGRDHARWHRRQSDRRLPTASYVLLITDPSFAAGVISQKNRVHGTLKGQGYSTVIVDYVQNEQKVEPGEQFFTSGDDRIFPKGLPVGEATVVRNGKSYKEIFVTPSGLQNGLEEVLIVVEGVHVPIPDAPAAAQPVHLQDAPPAEQSSTTDIAPVQSGPLPLTPTAWSINTAASAKPKNTSMDKTAALPPTTTSI